MTGEYILGSAYDKNSKLPHVVAESIYKNQGPNKWNIVWLFDKISVSFEEFLQMNTRLLFLTSYETSNF